MDPDRPDGPELDADAIAAPPDGPAMAADGSLHHDYGPELDLERIEAPAAELVLEVDDAPPLAPAPPAIADATEEEEEVAPTGARGFIAQARDSLRADSTRLLRTGLKAAVWLGIGTLVLSHEGVLAAIVAGALAGDMVVWFIMRILELPRHLWTFQFEAMINLGAVWVMIDVMHLFEAFRHPNLLPFGVVAFFLVGIGRFAVWWIPKALEA